MFVFVLDVNKRPLAPTHPACARQLLRKGKAAVYRKYPFTIILKREIQESDTEQFRLKIDPGSKITGIAILNDKTGEVVFATELQHRGQQIKKAMDSRRAVRRSRRNRKTRYRKTRFSNRTRPEGWLSPSLFSRVANIETWVKRLCRLSPIVAISFESAKFDTQKMAVHEVTAERSEQNPEINGVEYQHGKLAGYNVKEYLLEKFGRKCVYCGKDNVPLEVEHIIPPKRGGSNRVSNLAIACRPCNLKKGNKTAKEFGYPKVQEQAKKPLKDVAVLNITCKAIVKRLKATGLPIEVGTGALTKYNRLKRKLPKAHWLDAACIGESTPQVLEIEGIFPLLIVAIGHGSRQMCRVDKYGFPRTKAKQFKRVHGFQSGDIVKAIVQKTTDDFVLPPTGKKAGIYIGRVSIRASGSFNLKTENGTVQGISHRHCRLFQRADGYGYEERGTALPPAPLFAFHLLFRA